MLSEGEKALFRRVDPAGYILFGRNVADAGQLRALTDDLRAISGRDRPAILIDQEGGRVARLAPPLWPAFPAGAAFDRLYDVAPASAIAAARANGLALALMLSDVGITVNCAPSLDVRDPAAHDVIGDRSLGAEPLRVAALGRAMLEGMADGGVVGVIKHLPGHGRATVDSHLGLPRVAVDEQDLARDIAPFAALANSAQMAMTAHIIYSAWDAGLAATLSSTIIGEVIRKRIGFDGLLMSDDIEMQALSGSLAERANATLNAGCDVALHCSGDLAAMEWLAGEVPPIQDRARQRLDHAMALVVPHHDADALAAAIHRRDSYLALASA